MRAYAITTTEHSRALRETHLPEPRPSAGQVTINVQYTGLGMVDALWESGLMPTDPGFVPGLEVSGTIRELGAGVTAFTVGERVAAFLPDVGGLAEIACAPAALTVPVPGKISTELASVSLVNTATAYGALTTVARFSEGETLLVHAGVGGLGSQFLHVARALGAGRIDSVVGTEAKAKKAREIGYDNAFLRSDLASVPSDAYDLVIDPVGGEAVENALRNLRGGGRLVKVGNASQREDVMLSSLALWLQNKTATGFNVGAWSSMFPEQANRSLHWVLENISDGTVRVELSQVGDWSEINDMLGKLRAGDTTGKLAIRVQGT